MNVGTYVLTAIHSGRLSQVNIPNFKWLIGTLQHTINSKIIAINV